MSKVVLQVSNISRVKSEALEHSKLIIMGQGMMMDIARGQEAGFLVHFIALTPYPVDFVCFSIFLADWPDGTKTREVISRIKSYYLSFLNRDQEYIEGWFTGLELPTAKNAFRVTWKDLEREVTA